MHKLSISRAWDETKAILVRDGRLLSTVALALFVLPGVIADVASPTPAPGELPPLGYWTVLSAMAILIALIGQLAVIRLAVGSRLTVGEAIGHGARRTPAYLAASILWLLPFLLIVSAAAASGRGAGAQSLSAGVAVVILLVPLMLFLAIRMMMTAPVAGSEDVGPIAILKRSWALTAGNWWRLFGFFLLFFIAVLILMVAVGSVAGLVARLLFGDLEPMTLGALLVSLVSQLLAAAVIVLFMVMLARIYVQLSGGGSAEVSVPSSGT